MFCKNLSSRCNYLLLNQYNVIWYNDICSFWGGVFIIYINSKVIIFVIELYDKKKLLHWEIVVILSIFI